MNTRAKSRKCGDMPAENSQPKSPELVDAAEVGMKAVDELLEPLKLKLEGYCEQICQFAAEEEEDVPNDL
ncbi:hypothetical protein BV898_02551 [Hypsibius exemplaris]|uniref:Uncharacterized protein n=1 Tax=Hypsibius exemplaris TaxID=2072580 RepID=A0A1W0X7B1_HYPEX|nr:hypothetical protein BV898_02551 [Hypsibius exemplaris]